MKSIGYLIAGVAVAAVLSQPLLHAQTAPKFAVDPTWPKDLPEGWITGQLGGVCTSAQDHVYEFFFCAPPLPITKAVGSPVNPIAIK